jgi:hypothetical protein
MTSICNQYEARDKAKHIMPSLNIEISEVKRIEDRAKGRGGRKEEGEGRNEGWGVRGRDKPDWV